MNEEFKTQLNEVIVDELSRLGGYEEVESFSRSVDGVTKLMDRAIEIKKLEIEHEDKVRNHEAELCLKTKQLESELELKTKQLDEQIEARRIENADKLRQFEEDRKHRRIQTGISIAGIVLPIVVTIWGTKKSFEFEKEGTITTIMGRGFVNKLLPKK